MPISWSYVWIRFYSVSAMITAFSTFVLRTVVVRFNQSEIWKTAFEKCLEQNSSRMVNPFFLQNMNWTQQEVCVWCSSDWRRSFTFVNVHRLLLSILVYPVTFRNTVKLATIVFFKRNDFFQSYGSWNSQWSSIGFSSSCSSGGVDGGSSGGGDRRTTYCVHHRHVIPHVLLVTMLFICPYCCSV